jgi:lysozyme
LASALDKARARLAARKKALAAAKALVTKAAAKVAETARTVKRLTVPKGQRTSEKGVAFIARREGVRQYAYNDSANNATFGIGHLLHMGPVNAADRAKWGTPQNPKPMSLVNEVFHKDVLKYETAVRKAVGRDLDPWRFDACVSLCLNIGQAGFSRSTVAREAKAGHWQLAADAFLLWDKPPELRGRRQLERSLFLTGRYG